VRFGRAHLDAHVRNRIRDVAGAIGQVVWSGPFDVRRERRIDRRVRNLPSPRPLTHDLVANAVEQMGGEIQDVVISDLKEHTYFAKLRIRHEGELIEVDSRPSDAIALAVTAKVPIYVSEDVLQETEEENTLED
jgi:bifunctional DNase/RNase